MSIPAKPFGFEFPRRIFAYELPPGSIEDYESRAPGLGYGALYEMANVYSRSLSAFIYDLGQAQIPSDPQDKVIKDEFVRSVREVVQSASYSATDVTDHGLYSFTNGRHVWCAYLDLTTADGGQQQRSLLALTSWGGKFLKLRLSQPPGPMTDMDFKQVLGEWIAHVGAP